MLDSGEAKYIIPRGDGVGEPIILDISAVVKAESRLRDVAIVNTHNAAELLAVFNEHWLTLHRNVTQLTYERNRADDAAKRAFAEALLDCNDDAVKKRGHSKTSQDLREALATVNILVIAARDRLNEIKAVLDYLVGKRQAFENAYNSVKKLVSTPQLPTEKLNHGAPQQQQRPPQRYASPPAKTAAEIFGDDDIPFGNDSISDNQREMIEDAAPVFSSKVQEGFDEPTYGMRRY